MPKDGEGTQDAQHRLKLSVSFSRPAQPEPLFSGDSGILSSFAVLRHLRRSAATCLRRLWMTNRPLRSRHFFTASEDAPDDVSYDSIATDSGSTVAGSGCYAPANRHITCVSKALRCSLDRTLDAEEAP
jgi:hypothetical protein